MLVKRENVMNKSTFARICGILKGDLELRQCSDGKSYGVISVAVNRASQSSKRSIESFIVQFWNKEIIAKYNTQLKEGVRVWAKGDLRRVPLKKFSSDDAQLVKCSETILKVRRNDELGVFFSPVSFNTQTSKSTIRS